MNKIRLYIYDTYRAQEHRPLSCHILPDPSAIQAAGKNGRLVLTYADGHYTAVKR